ncbi:MAG: hypothetical protein K2K68_06660 [Duncaniella sp.]|nr:hypothetical protein [Duncaniella sp.]
MKKFIYFLLCAVFFAGLTTVSTSAAEKTKKTRKEINAEYRKEFDTKASKSARKRAKELTKKGWRPIGAGKSIEAQLDRAWQYEEPNEDGELEYIVQSGTAVGNTLSSAQAAAKQQARLAIAKSLETEMGAIIEGSINHKELSDEEVRDVNEMNEVNTSFVQQKLKRTIVITEWYRDTDNGKYQVEVSMALKISTLKEEATEAWLSGVKNKNEELYKKLSGKLEQNKSK